jgi:hypothetical protein
LDERQHRFVRPANELPGERQLDAQGDQPLLTSVMEIAFDTAPLSIRDVRQACP